MIGWVHAAAAAASYHKLSLLPDDGNAEHVELFLALLHNKMAMRQLER